MYNPINDTGFICCFLEFRFGGLNEMKYVFEYLSFYLFIYGFNNNFGLMTVVRFFLVIGVPA